MNNDKKTEAIVKQSLKEKHEFTSEKYNQFSIESRGAKGGVVTPPYF